jgi:predicted RNA polymerase sigma factor
MVDAESEARAIEIAAKVSSAPGPGGGPIGNRIEVRQAMSRGAIGEYQLQAAIAACHDEAERADDTDWPQLLGLYTLLERMTGNPMVELNRAIAAAMVQGPTRG